MSAKMYIVVERGGEYEDKWKRNLLVATSVEVAQHFVEYAKLANAIDLQMIDMIHDITSAVDNSDAIPFVEYEELEIIPKWGSGIKQKDITPEMRAERTAVTARNTARLDDYRDKASARAAAVIDLVVEKIVALGYSQDIAHHYITDTWYDGGSTIRFEIEEVQVL